MRKENKKMNIKVHQPNSFEELLNIMNAEKKEYEEKIITKNAGTRHAYRDHDAERDARTEYWEMQQRNGTCNEDEEWERD